MISFRKIRLLVFGYIFVSLIILTFYLAFLHRSSGHSFSMPRHWFENGTPVKCSLPFNIDPFDYSIKSYIEKLSSEIHCSLSHNSKFHRLYNLDGHRSLSYMNDEDSIVRIFKIKGYQNKLLCYYRSLERDGTSDDEIKFSEEKLIIGHSLNLEKLGLEFVVIRCEYKGETIYENVHFWPTKVPVQNNQTISSNQISVLIFVVESLSYLNFKRFMHRTEEQLSLISNQYILRGLVKMADNTFPNMLPLLAGVRPYAEKWPFPTGIDGPFDSLPLIWKDFKKNNYTTGYVEDYPPLGLFNYLSSGFTHPPTDWYPRPVWLKMQKDQGIESFKLCYKGRSKLDFWLQQVKQFLNKTKKSSYPFFLWSFYMQVTHNEFNKAQLIDSRIADFLRDYRHILDKTVFIFMGDHGNRFGPILETSVGRVETSMPFFSMHIPNSLLQAHPHLDHYMKLNQKRLTTWLDVREILRDINSSNFSLIVSKNKGSSYSPWRQEVPLERTCKDALIPNTFCLCEERKALPTDSTVALEAAEALVRKLNEMLVTFKNLCAALTLDIVKNAEMINRESNVSLSVEVLITVNPSGGIFQGQLKKSLENFEKSEWQVDSDISRLNRYGAQSSCIEDKVLRKYCFCRQNVS